MVRIPSTCINNVVTKTAAVRDGLRRFGDFPGMDELYRRGAFRHIEDVAYARIALEKFKSTVDKIARELDESYVTDIPFGHRCDRIYPPT